MERDLAISAEALQRLLLLLIAVTQIDDSNSGLQ